MNGMYHCGNSRVIGGQFGAICQAFKEKKKIKNLNYRRKGESMPNMSAGYRVV